MSAGNGNSTPSRPGWTLAIKSGKRTLIYLIPLNGSFKVNFVFGEKAISAAETGGISAEIIKMIADAIPYAEGRSFMIDVNGDADADTVMKLVALKNSN